MVDETNERIDTKGNFYTIKDRGPLLLSQLSSSISKCSLSWFTCLLLLCFDTFSHLHLDYPESSSLMHVALLKLSMASHN